MADSDSMFLTRSREWLARLDAMARRWRGLILATASVLFGGGIVWSLVSLNLTWADVRLLPLMVMAFVFVPLSIAYSAINLKLMAVAVNASMTFVSAAKISVFAGVVELLPLPGGAVVRSVSLTRSGGTAHRSVELVVAFGLLWIACAALGATIALSTEAHSNLVLISCTVLAIVAIVLWIAHRFNLAIALGALALRFLGLPLVAVRVGFAFMVFGLAFEWLDTLAFTFAIIAGTAAAIVPSGLGVSEGLSAIMATQIDIAPEGAFLAVAMSRIVGLLVNLVAVVCLSLGKRGHQFFGEARDG